MIDSRALVAILLGEAEASCFTALIEADAVRLVSTTTVLETSMVIGTRKGPAGIGELDRLLFRASIEEVPFNREQAGAARRAWLQFGKGRHKAALNFGDCCSYALAKVSGEPLLAKGDDFVRIDITLAGPGSLSGDAWRPN